MASGQSQYRPGGSSGAASGGGGTFGGGGDPNSPAGGGGGGGGSLEEAIPGVPGEDYPIFAEVPETSFLCDGQVDGGYYGDPEAECQTFHICAADGTGGLTKYSFLCPNGTLFNQQYFICDWWFNVDCSLTVDLYSLNEEIAAEREANSPAGGGDGYSGGGGGGGGGARGGGNSQRGGGGGGQRGGSASRSSSATSGGGPRGSVSASAGGQGSYKGGSAGSGAGGLTRSRGTGGGSSRGSSAGGGRGGSSGGRPGGRKGNRGSSSAGQPSYGSASSGGGNFGDDYDYDGSAVGSVIPGYGAPGGDGGFPPLNSYNRKSRQLGEIDIQQVIQDLEIETGAEILGEEKEVEY